MEVRERSGCFVKQPSHELKFRNTKQLPSIIRVVVAMQLTIFLFFYPQIKGYHPATRQSKQQSIVEVKSSKDYVAIHETVY